MLTTHLFPTTEVGPQFAMAVFDESPDVVIPYLVGCAEQKSVGLLCLKAEGYIIGVRLHHRVHLDPQIVRPVERDHIGNCNITPA